MANEKFSFFFLSFYIITIVATQFKEKRIIKRFQKDFLNTLTIGSDKHII